MIEKLIDELLNLSDQIKRNCNVSNALQRINSILAASWTDEKLLSNEVLETILGKADSESAGDKFEISKILLKYLETPKRFLIAGKYLENSVKLAKVGVSDSLNVENVLIAIKILQILFDIDEEVSEKVFKLGGLNAIVASCDSKDYKVLEACSLGIFKVVLNGGKNCETFLMKNDSISQWLLPMLNIYDDRSIKFYAYLSVTYLRTVRGKLHEIFRNGLLDDVVHWISEEETHNKLLNTVSMNSYDKKREIKKILPMMIGSCKVSQTLGAFLMCCEIYRNVRGIKSELKIYSKSEKLITALQRIVLVSNETGKKFASSALAKMNEDVPSIVDGDILTWKKRDVEKWLKVIGFSDYQESLTEVGFVNIITLQNSELREKFFMFDESRRQSFMNELEILKKMTSTKVRSLKDVEKLQISKSSINALAVENGSGQIANGSIANDAGTSNVTTATIAIKDKPNDDQPPVNSRNKTEAEEKVTNTIETSIEQPKRIKKKIDVFISYRRSNGSELASLLKVHLTMKGFKVFFDVESLRAGHFGRSLIKSVQQAKNFVLILTPNALDRCIDDHEDKDWVKKEILTALVSDCNIIPVAKDFDFKIYQEENLPGDIKSLANLNQIVWHHEVQVCWFMI